MQNTLVTLMSQIGQLTQALAANNVAIPPLIQNDANAPTKAPSNNQSTLPSLLHPSSSVPALKTFENPQPQSTPIARYQQQQQQLQQQQQQQLHRRRKQHHLHPMPTSSSSSSSSLHRKTKAFKPDMRGSKKERIAATKNKYANAWMPRVAKLGENYVAPPLPNKVPSFETKDRNSAAQKTTQLKPLKQHRQTKQSTTASVSTTSSTTSRASSLPSSSTAPTRTLPTKNPTKTPTKTPSPPPPTSPPIDYNKIAVKYKECRSTVFIPSKWEHPSPQQRARVTTAPSMELELEHIYGGGGSGNSYMLGSGEIIYGIGMSVLVVENPSTKQQRFFKEHDGATVTSLAIHPDGNIVASGQKGAVLVWDSGAVIEGSSSATTSHTVHHSNVNGHSFKSNHLLDQLHVLRHGVSDEEMFTLQTLDLIVEPSSSSTAASASSASIRVANGAIVALDFSGDGKLLVGMCNDPGHTIFVWNWKCKELLTTTKGSSNAILGIKFNPFSFYGIPDYKRPIDEREEQDEEKESFAVFDPLAISPRPGQAPTIEDAVYTLVSHGERHLKFWVLQTEENPAKKNHHHHHRHHSSRFTSVVWKMEGQSPSPSRLVETNQTFSALGFVDDSEPLRIGLRRDTTPWHGMTSRILVGTSRGDIYMYVQPRAAPGHASVAPEDPHATALTTPPSTTWTPWWEEEQEQYRFANDGDLSIPKNSQAQRTWSNNSAKQVRFEKIGKIVHCVPHSIEEGNKRLLTKEALHELKYLYQLIQTTKERGEHFHPDDQLKIDQKIQELSYQGSLGHCGHAITSIACQHNELDSRIITTSPSNGTIVQWRITMDARPQFRNLNGSTASTPGHHDLIELHRIHHYTDLTVYRDLDMLNATERRPCGSAIRHLCWVGRRLVATTTTGTVMQLNADTFDGQTINECTNGGTNGDVAAQITTIKAHPFLPLFATTSQEGVLRLWRGDPGASLDAENTSWGVPNARRMDNKHRMWYRESVCQLDLGQVRQHNNASMTALDFHPSLMTCVVGTNTGELLVVHMVMNKTKEEKHVLDEEFKECLVAGRLDMAGFKVASITMLMPNPRTGGSETTRSNHGGANGRKTNKRRISPSARKSAGRTRRKKNTTSPTTSPQRIQRTSPTRSSHNTIDCAITVVKYSPDGKELQ